MPMHQAESTLIRAEGWKRPWNCYTGTSAKGAAAKCVLLSVVNHSHLHTYQPLRPDVRHLADVLLGLSPRTRSKDWHDIEFYDGSLNDSQRQAIRFVLSSNELACIHGPPGELPTAVCIVIESLNERQGRAKPTRSSRSSGSSYFLAGRTFRRVSSPRRRCWSVARPTSL